MLNLPEIVLGMFINNDIDGYTYNNIRLVWVLKLITRRHSKLRDIFTEEESINISLWQPHLIKEYEINLLENKYDVKIIKFDDLGRRTSIDVISDCFRMNTVSFE